MMVSKKYVIFDLWDNITKISHDGVTATQEFIDNDIIQYEDSYGNYWNITFGFDNPFPYFIGKPPLSPYWGVSEFNGTTVLTSYDVGSITSRVGINVIEPFAGQLYYSSSQNAMYVNDGGNWTLRG